MPDADVRFETDGYTTQDGTIVEGSDNLARICGLDLDVPGNGRVVAFSTVPGGLLVEEACDLHYAVRLEPEHLRRLIAYLQDSLIKIGEQ